VDYVNVKIRYSLRSMT